MFVWITLVGCTTTEPETAPEPAEKPAAPEAGKQKRGKGKTKGKAGKAGKSPQGPGGACPEGVLANAGWEGEYPSPVVDVTKEVAAKGRKQPCQPEATEACTVPAAIYHPWSEAKAGYTTVRGIDRYKVLQDTKLGELDVAAGSEIAVTQYLSEGFCIIDVAGQSIEETCPGVVEGDARFEKIPGPEVKHRQLVEVACTEGAKLWVDAEELMKLPGVREGEVLEFGTVGPGK